MYMFHKDFMKLKKKKEMVYQKLEERQYDQSML